MLSHQFLSAMSSVLLLPCHQFLNFDYILQNQIYKPMQPNIDHVNEISIFYDNNTIQNRSSIIKIRTYIFSQKKNPNYQNSLNEENSITIFRVLMV